MSFVFLQSILNSFSEETEKFDQSVAIIKDYIAQL